MKCRENGLCWLIVGWLIGDEREAISNQLINQIPVITNQLSNYDMDIWLKQRFHIWSMRHANVNAYMACGTSFWLQICEESLNSWLLYCIYFRVHICTRRSMDQSTCHIRIRVQTCAYLLLQLLSHSHTAYIWKLSFSQR